MIKQISLLAIAFAMTGNAFSQSSYLAQNISPGVGFATDINGRPMYLKTEYVAEGSPYLYEEYCLAEITSMSGKVYSNVKAKLNLQEKLLLYSTDNGMDMLMVTPIKKVKFYNYISNGVSYPDRIFQSHQMAINAENAPIFEVLAEDSSAILLKQTSINFNDSKAYGASTITRTFNRRETYFAAIPAENKELLKVEKNKTSTVALFGAKAPAISAFIEQKKLKCKSETELIQVFHYYFSL